jgi:hypothetical protein
MTTAVPLPANRLIHNSTTKRRDGGKTQNTVGQEYIRCY